RGARPQREQGALAVTGYRVLERHQSRALLELRPGTARRHQIRGQIAATGARIFGDRRYRQAVARRRTLRPGSPRFLHPTKKRELVLEAPIPDSFTKVLRNREDLPFESVESIERLMREAADRRHWLGHLKGTTAFRLVHELADGLPGVALDLYGEHLLLHL